MKILIVSTYYEPYKSGMTAYAKTLAEGLAKKGHKVTVLTSRFRRDLAENEIVNGVRIKRIPVMMKVSKGCVMPSFVYMLRKLARENDVVNLHAPMFEILFATLAVPRKKIVVTYHCDLSLKNKFAERIYYGFLFMALRNGLRVVVNNLDYHKNSRIRNFPAVEIFPPVKMELKYCNPKTLRREMGLKNDKDEKIVGFLGRLVEEKGVEFLINSVRFIKLKNFKILIAGANEIAGGSLSIKLRYEAKKYGDKIKFIGEIAEHRLAEFYSLCDVFVLPSVGSLESFGLVQVEAMLCGTPVVATDLAGVRKLVDLTKMGLVVKQRDSKLLGEAIAKIILDRKKFILPREKVLETFDNENCFKSYERVFTKVQKSKVFK